MASSGVPYPVPDLVFTSQATSTRRSTATMSISPSAHRQLRSSIRKPGSLQVLGGELLALPAQGILGVQSDHLRFRRWRNRVAARRLTGIALWRAGRAAASGG